jgi:hypothetical protein
VYPTKPTSLHQHHFSFALPRFHFLMKNASNDAGAITFSGTLSGTFVGARSGAGAGAGVWAGFGTVSGMSIGVEPG